LDGKGHVGAKPKAEAIAEILTAIKERREWRFSSAWLDLQISTETVSMCGTPTEEAGCSCG
jgi:molybdopterin/thiamine biosynthesis adenylyltransferase